MKTPLMEKERNKTDRFFMLALLGGLCVLVFFISVAVGSARLSPLSVLKAIFVETTGVNRQVIWTIRLPRTIIAALVGVCLSLSGGILQGVMRNPLATPNIIGVSSGAGLAAVIIFILFPGYYHLVTPAAFLGALGATLLIYRISWKKGVDPYRLILSGVAVSAFLGAGVNTLMILYPERVQNVIGFLVGGLAALTWSHVAMIAPYAAAGFILANLGANRLNILMLGDEVASSLGLSVEKTRMFFIILASLLAAASVSIVGLLGFVGLIVPHVARILIGSNYRYLFPASALLGAALVMACDTAARMILNPIELPVGILMAVLGAPFFLYLVRTKQGWNSGKK